MPDEFGEHLTRDQRSFIPPYRISPDPSDSQIRVGADLFSQPPLLMFTKGVIYTYIHR